MIMYRPIHDRALQLYGMLAQTARAAPKKFRAARRLVRFFCVASLSVYSYSGGSLNKK